MTIPQKCLFSMAQNHIWDIIFHIFEFSEAQKLTLIHLNGFRLSFVGSVGFLWVIHGDFRLFRVYGVSGHGLKNG